MALVQRRCFRVSIANASATPNSNIWDWCIAPALSSTKTTSRATKTPLSISSTPPSRLTWWFDHHQSAFLTPEDASHFEQDLSNTKFYDPDFRSCTKFIASVTQQRFGFNPALVAELIEWADIIDGALYSDPQSAVEMKEPAMKLTMVIESNQDPQFLPTLIPMLAYKPLAEIIAEPMIAGRIPLLTERHFRSIDILRERATCKDGTIFFDVTDHELEGYNKFVPYYLHPNCVYSVGLSKSSFRTKVSVGSNPWSKIEPVENLARICERYGGGGHARVGAVSFPPGSWRRHARRRRTWFRLTDQLPSACVAWWRWACRML